MTVVVGGEPALGSLVPDLAMGEHAMTCAINGTWTAPVELSWES
jgi:hypothetical protein